MAQLFGCVAHLTGVLLDRHLQQLALGAQADVVGGPGDLQCVLHADLAGLDRLLGVAQVLQLTSQLHLPVGLEAGHVAVRRSKLVAEPSPLQA